jgi:hypothetical protein
LFVEIRQWRRLAPAVLGFYFKNDGSLEILDVIRKKPTEILALFGFPDS